MIYNGRRQRGILVVCQTWAVVVVVVAVAIVVAAAIAVVVVVVFEKPHSKHPRHSFAP